MKETSGGHLQKEGAKAEKPKGWHKARRRRALSSNQVVDRSQTDSAVQSPQTLTTASFAD